MIGSTSPRLVRSLTKIVNFPSPVATSAKSKNNPGGGTLNVRKFQKEIVVSSFLPKKRKKKSSIVRKSGTIREDAMAKIKKTHSIIFWEI